MHCRGHRLCPRILQRKGAGVSKFPTIKKLGLSISEWGDGDKTSVVLAHELESILKSAKVVYGSPDTPSDQLAWSCTQLDCDTHKAILLNIEPLKKKTKAEAALEFVASMAPHMSEAKRILEMKDEV